MEIPAADICTEICNKNVLAMNLNESKVLLHPRRDCLRHWSIQKAALLKWNLFHSKMPEQDIRPDRCHKNQRFLPHPNDRHSFGPGRD